MIFHPYNHFLMHSNEQSTNYNLSNQEAIEKLKELAEKSGNCFFATALSGFPVTARPMVLQEVDEMGTLWFISSKQSAKNHEIVQDNRVALYFQNNASYEFLTLSGRATIHTEKHIVEKYWNPLATAWFDGKDDPNITMIAVKPIDSMYWETKDGKIISFMRMSFGAVTNIKTDGGIVEGKLKI